MGGGGVGDGRYGSMSCEKHGDISIIIHGNLIFVDHRFVLINILRSLGMIHSRT